jgi:hypothetical protein
LKAALLTRKFFFYAIDCNGRKCWVQSSAIIVQVWQTIHWADLCLIDWLKKYH